MCPFDCDRSYSAPDAASTRSPENRHKILVKVRADHHTDGSIRPVSFVPPDGTKVAIERVLDMREAASRKAGGQGLRYTVRVSCGGVNRELYLFDEDGVWFIEEE